MTLVDLKDPHVQAKVKAAGIRWNMRQYEEGLEISADKAKEIGVTKMALKREEEIAEKAATRAMKAKAAEEKAIAEKAEAVQAEAEKKAKIDAAIAAKAATAAITPTAEQVAAAKAAEMARRAK